jgi:hypothetical protein
VEANQIAHREAGHWGVPTIAFNGKPFFGQDRFDQFKWRLEQQGLKRRAPCRPSGNPRLNRQRLGYLKGPPWIAFALA